MKKLLLLSILALMVAACTSTDTTTDRLSRQGDVDWYQDIGEPDSDYWWVNEYEDEQSDQAINLGEANASPFLFVKLGKEKNY